MKDKLNKNKNDQEFFNQFLESIPDETKNYVRLSMDIASQVNNLLEKENISQRELADRLGKKESEVSKWLSGNHNFTIKSLAKIETVLEEQFLFTREEITDRFMPFLFRQFKELYSAEHYGNIINYYFMNEKANNNVFYVFPEKPAPGKTQTVETKKEKIKTTSDHTNTTVFSDEYETSTAA